MPIPKTNHFPSAVARYFDDALARATALGVSWTDIDNRAKRYDCEPTLFAYIDDTKNRCPGARLPHLSNPSDAYKTSESIDRSTDNASTIDSGSSNRYDAHLSNDRFHHFITSNHSTFYNYCKSLYENHDNILNHLHYPSKFIEYCTKLKLIEVAIHQMRSLFDEAQIPFILLKGAPMGQAIFGSARARSTTDIDVWIPRAYRSRTRQLLATIGYRRLESPHIWATNQEIVYHDVLAPIEIHWRLALPSLDAPDFDEAYLRSRRDNAMTNGVYTLATCDMWILLLTHAIEHSFALKTRLDIIAFCSNIIRSNDDCRAEHALHAHAKKYRLERLSIIAFDFTRFIFQHAKIDQQHVHRSNGKYSNSNYHSFNNNEYQPLNKLIYRILYKNMCNLWLRDSSFAAQLVTGRDDKCDAMTGLALRSLLMLAQDAPLPAVRSAMKSFFYGPHRLGHFFYRLRCALGVYDE